MSHDHFTLAPVRKIRIFYLLDDVTYYWQELVKWSLWCWLLQTTLWSVG